MIQETEIHTGSSFEAFLEEEGIREEVEAAAIKRVLAWQAANPNCTFSPTNASID